VDGGLGGDEVEDEGGVLCEVLWRGEFWGMGAPEGGSGGGVDELNGRRTRTLNEL